MDTDDLFRATTVLLHPRNLPVQAEGFRIMRTRPDAPWWTVIFQFDNSLRRGQFGAAEALLQDPSVPSDFKSWGTYQLLAAMLLGSLSTSPVFQILIKPAPDWQSDYGSS